MNAEADNEITIDESVRYSGKVLKFDRRRGFGYIQPDGKEETDKVFAHWRQITSSDEWPSLKEGSQVEYYLASKENAKRKSQKAFAAKITGPGGVAITVGDDNKTYLNRGQRFQGKVKFFDARKGFGFVSPSADFSFDGTDFKSTEAKIYLAREDIKHTSDIAPNLKDDQAVEFTLYKSKDKKDNDSYGAGDVTKIGGDAFSEDEFATKKCGWPKKRFNKGGKGGFGKMKGMNFGGGMPNVFMMNGMPFMMMPMGGGGGKKKWNKKNKQRGGSW